MGGRLWEHICNFKNHQKINLENTKDFYESNRNKNEHNKKNKGYDYTNKIKESIEG